MWLIFNDRLTNEDYFKFVGKSLLLCQKFEVTCKDILIWFTMTEAIINKKMDFFSKEHSDYVDKLHELFLGPNINNSAKKLKSIIDDKDIETIKTAKNARNFICHELCISFLISNDRLSKEFKWDKELSIQKIRAVAAGDYLVSRWAYEFHEKKSGAFKNEKDYIESTLNWVFS